MKFSGKKLTTTRDGAVKSTETRQRWNTRRLFCYRNIVVKKDRSTTQILLPEYATDIEKSSRHLYHDFSVAEYCCVSYLPLSVCFTGSSLVVVNFYIKFLTSTRLCLYSELQFSIFGSASNNRICSMLRPIQEQIVIVCIYYTPNYCYQWCLFLEVKSTCNLHIQGNILGIPLYTTLSLHHHVTLRGERTQNLSAWFQHAFLIAMLAKFFLC